MAYSTIPRTELSLPQCARFVNSPALAHIPRPKSEPAGPGPPAMPRNPHSCFETRPERPGSPFGCHNLALPLFSRPCQCSIPVNNWRDLACLMLWKRKGGPDRPPRKPSTIEGKHWLLPPNGRATDTRQFVSSVMAEPTILKSWRERSSTSRNRPPHCTQVGALTSVQLDQCVQSASRR